MGFISSGKDDINALCLDVWLASIMERVSSNPVRTMQDLAVFRNREYYPFVQALVLLHFGVEKPRSNKLPDDASPDGGTLGWGFPVGNFPDDRLPYVSSPEIGLQDHLRQGKVAELRQELNSGGKKDKNHSAKKIALKKIVANMTMSNNDMVALFPDIVDCMQIPSLEIKKMYVPR